ncbi:MAG: hypothetical protein C4294_11880, partial [Nitrospiraceae bacterium]
MREGDWGILQERGRGNGVVFRFEATLECGQVYERFEQRARLSPGLYGMIELAGPIVASSHHGKNSAG